MWNFRREVLQNMCPVPAQGGDDALRESRRIACVAEFELTQQCLGLNPKSYPVWHHRQWVLEWGMCAWQWPVELKLTSKFLALDDRNFHCWTYRRFVVQIAGVATKKELDFTTSKIEANFSNYSAWHYRSKLLPSIHAGADAHDFAAVLRDELQLVRNAFFTAPDDSSAWFYHRWLLAQLKQHTGGPEGDAEYEAALRDELSMVTELLELEPECKWALAAAAFLEAQLEAAVPVAGGEGRAGLLERLESLQAVDGMRTRYYKDLGIRAGL
jgi:geranylgeranyl transferase type-2 subunit alpha